MDDMKIKDELYDPEEATKPESQNGRRSPRRRSRSRSRSPRNWRRGERDRRSRDRDSRKLHEGPTGRVRLYVCNMPYDIKWQELKDVFKKEVGSAVMYVELYENQDGKPSGAGAVEVKGADNAEKAITKMDRYEMNGRKIIVREERDKDRMRHKSMGGGGMGGNMGGGMSGNMGGGMGIGGGGMGGGGMGGGTNSLMGSGMMSDMGGGMGMGGSGGMSLGGVPGINNQILQQLGIDPTGASNQIFVANLDYSVSEKKIREIFKMAGTIIDVDLKIDKEGKSRGFCIIRFEHAVEAVQAISMFNGQVLYDRSMSVKMDKMGENSYSMQQIPNKLPAGLKSIGMGLGNGGTPVNIQQLQSNMMGSGGGMGNMNSGMGMGNMNNMSNMGGGMGSGMGGMSGNMGSGMGNMGMGNMGNTGSLTSGSLGTGMGTGNMGNSGMGNLGMGTGMGSGLTGGLGMSMGNMSSTGMGGSLGGMGGDLTNSLGMRTGMTSPTGMGNMGTGMGMSDLSSNMGMGTGMGMTNTMNSLTGSMGLNSMTGSMGGSGLDSFRNSGGRDGMMQESTTVFVRNLPFSFGWQDLKTKFTKCGDVRFAEIKFENGKSKGYGTVKFSSPDDARRAVNLMNGVRIDGRQIEVRLNKV